MQVLLHVKLTFAFLFSFFQMEIFKVISAILINFWLFFHYLWIKFNKFMSRELFEKNSLLIHKIVVIGDGFAEGLGDYIVFGQKSGLCNHLDYIIRNTERVNF